MRYYPLFLDLKEKPVLVVGGGTVAQQKIEGLLAAQARIKVISPTLCPALYSLWKNFKITYENRLYQPGDLQGFILVFGATNNAQVNQQMHQEAQSLNILFNAVDQPKECDFIIPARVVRGDLTLAISTAGVAPFVAKFLRQKLENIFGEAYATWIHLLGNLRLQLIERNQKDKLMPFFEQSGEFLLTLLTEFRFEEAKRLLEQHFGDEITHKLLHYYDEPL